MKGLTGLHGLRAREVSLVKAGANRKRRFPVFKSENGMDIKQVLAQVIETESDADPMIAEITKGLNEKGVNAVKAAMRILSAFEEELPEGMMKNLEKLCSGKAEAEKAEPEATPEQIPETVAKSADTEEGEMPEKLEEIFKAQAAEIEILKKQNTDLVASIEADKDEQARQSWVRKASDELSHFPGESSEELGDMLHTLHKSNPEMAQAQFDRMKSASDAIKQGEVLKSAGTPGRSNSGAALEQLTAELISKSAQPMTEAEAQAAVLLTPEGRKAYASYLQDNPHQSAAR